MQYKLSNVVKKETSKGKPMIKCSLIDMAVGGGGAHSTDTGIVTDVAIWNNFPDFANLGDGSVVVGELEIKQNGQYTNKTLNYPKPAQTSSYGAYKKPQANMEKVMEKKEQSIGKFQDNKELSIKISSTMRMAVDCAIEESREAVRSNKPFNFSESILIWRKWLWENWDAKETDFDPFPSKPRIPDERVAEEDRQVSPQDIQDQFDKYPNLD